MTPAKEKAPRANVGPANNAGENIPTVADHATQSEQALLGAILQEPATVLPVVEAVGLTAASFSDDFCVRAMEAIFSLRANDVAVDLVTVSEKMPGDARVNALDLGDCVDLCPTPAHAEHYARQVAEAERRRRLSEAARMAVEQLAKGGAVDVVAAQLRAASEAAEGAEIQNGGLPGIEAALDFLAEPIPEPPQIVRGVFRVGQVGMIASTAKAGKTWLMQHLALAVPNGLPWLKWQTTPGRVLYVDPELPAYDGQTRLVTVANAMGLDSIPEGLDLWRVKGESLTIGEMIPKIQRRQDQAGAPYALILLDSLYCLNGGRDENDNAEQAKTMQEFYALTAKTGAAVLVTHHFSKGNKSKTDHLDRASGAGVFTRAPDVFMTLTPHREPDCYSVETTCRSFPRPEPFVARWAFPLWKLADDLDPNCLKRHGEGRVARFTPQQMVDLLPSDGLTYVDWLAEAKTKLGCSKSTFNKLLTKIKAGKLVFFGFGKYIPERDSGDGE